jgi:P-type conjugative transfer protein TrbG
MIMRAFLLATAFALPVGLHAEATRPVAPIAAATQAARVLPRPAGWRGATQLFVYSPGGLYVVTAAVGQVTDIVLQEGETLSDTGAVAAGDTVRWVIGEASSGDGATRRTHILVKPTDPALATNLVINTNKRTYHVELRSTPRVYVASVGWSYPQDELIAVQHARDVAEARVATQVQVGIDPTKLDFGYRLTGPDLPWKPAQVFDDGAKTYVVMPAGIGQSELPPLFLLGERGKAELVNYRVSGRYLIVDRLFAVAELRLGTTKQQVIRITRTSAERQS